MPTLKEQVKAHEIQLQALSDKYETLFNQYQVQPPDPMTPSDLASSNPNDLIDAMVRLEKLETTVTKLEETVVKTLQDLATELAKYAEAGSATADLDKTLDTAASPVDEEEYAPTP